MPTDSRRGTTRQPAPDVSVIVPCYNAAETLPDTITSIRSQTFENWEAVCVDDGSTDRTPELLDAFARADRRIRATGGPHRCPAAARNRGLTLARADRVLFLDADDVLRPTALAALLSVARTADARTIVTGGYELLDHHGEPLSVYHFPSAPRCSVDAFLRGNRLPPMTLVPTALLDTPAFREDQAIRGCEDWDLWLRLARAGARCVTVPRVLFGYRLRAGSLSHNADRMFDAGRRTIAHWLPRAAEPESLSDVVHRWACACAGIALAAGSAHAGSRYFEQLPPLQPTDEFHHAAADGFRWAFQFVRGAARQTWSSHAHEWLAEIETWLASGPLAVHTPRIMDCLSASAHSPREYYEYVRDFLSNRANAERLVIYGLGTNGLNLLERLRSDPREFPRLCIADDHAPPATFELLGLPHDDPRAWKTWPPNTIAVVTPNDADAMRTTLRRAGGREGIDFLTPDALEKNALQSVQIPEAWL